MEPVWTEEDVLPKKLIDLINEDEFSDNESDIEMDNSDSTTDESESEIESNSFYDATDHYMLFSLV